MCVCVCVCELATAAFDKVVDSFTENTHILAKDIDFVLLYVGFNSKQALFSFLLYFSSFFTSAVVCLAEEICSENLQVVLFCPIK